MLPLTEKPTSCPHCRSTDFHTYYTLASSGNRNIDSYRCTGCGVIYEVLPEDSTEEEITQFFFGGEDGWVNPGKIPTRQPLQVKSGTPTPGWTTSMTVGIGVANISALTSLTLKTDDDD